MKKSQLRQIIKEEISKVLNEEEIKLEKIVGELMSKYSVKSEMELIEKLKAQYKDEFKITDNLKAASLQWEKEEGKPGIPDKVWKGNIVPFINKLIGAFPPPNNAMNKLLYIVNSIKKGRPEDLSTK